MMGISAKRIAALAILLAATGGCAGVSERAPSSALRLDSMDSLFFETGNWGRPSKSWRLYRDGSGEYRMTEGVPSMPDFRSYNIVLRRFNAGPEGFERVRALLAEAARLAARGLRCRTILTDTGSTRFGGYRADSVALAMPLDHGCLSPQMDRVYGQIAQADRLVGTWAASQPVVEVEEIRGGVRSPAP